MARTAHGVEGVRALPLGEELGRSDLHEITQEAVDTFADATGDHQWIHVDPERAKDGPFGGTIAHGYLTLSLVPRLLPEILEITGFSLVVNYGCEKVRFPSPVPVGSTVRATAVLDEVTEVKGGLQLAITMTIGVEDAAKPACVVTFLTRQLV
ncbi:MaoC family dehydratase [Pseudonocardia sp. McavD-2-B]|uniref:MaoC family dehydratase n=1 Tax=Pseudonocardia sp. McavD-2-B TaxID=2954499 RepID=UPI0020977C23|nr:MaoC family dehydratase [Pseudonocardia sp. McavD-2-B]MCO7191443.1 MaoC family dehydratase [Pseudonocardia sp. McavD-2-B]